MKIVHVWDGDYPWDIRVNKISESLVRAGHEVHIACRNIARKQRQCNYNGYSIHRMLSLPVVFGKLNSIIGLPAFFNPLWIYHIYKTAKTNQCELIIVRDLPLAPGCNFSWKNPKNPLCFGYGRVLS